MKPLSLMLTAAALAVPQPAGAQSSALLHWGSCGRPTASSADVAARTQCARLVVPRDYANPAAGSLDLDVVRVIAGGKQAERHAGTLLLEPDEFTGGIGASVTAMASNWLAGDDGWRDVAARIDLVGLAQRRMDDAGGHDCLSATSRLPRHASLGSDTSKPNLAAAEGLARAIATACQNDPMHAHIGMRPRVEDIAGLREALGQPQLHLLGVGRGGWVAARYAEAYPRHVGRMLLDSSWDMDGSVVEAVEARVEERGRAVRRARAARGDKDRAVRDAAERLLAQIEAEREGDSFGFGPRAAGAEPALLASAFAARCNDGFWGNDRRYWRQRTLELRETWPSGLENETFQGMVCSLWPAAFGKTAVPVLDRAPPFLMVHAEFDSEAPLRGAAMSLNAHDNATMVVARGLRAHGVLEGDVTPCVSSVASRFLADGVLPALKLTNCRHPEPSPGS